LGVGAEEMERIFDKMTEFQKDILALLKTALLDAELKLSNSADLARIYGFAEEQQLVPLLYSGVLLDPRLAAHPAASKFLERFLIHVSHDADQRDTVEQIFRAFEEAGVSYMPVKGTLLKNLYPSPEMRTMGDADILIRMEEYDRVQAAMQSLGCTFAYESDHEYSWKTPTGLLIELHKRLIPSYNRDYYAYYGDGWDFARHCKDHGFRYEMTREDTFIYLFSHFAKHYRDQGAGMKYVIDFYLYNRAYPDLDESYLQEELEKLHLTEFYRNIMYLLKVWFEDAPETEVSAYLTNRMFNDGVFGQGELNVISEGVKLSKDGHSAKKEKKKQLFFPPYRSMCLRYPILEHWAILLPLFWLIRLFDLAIHHRDRYRRAMNRLDKMSDEKIIRYQQELNYVGLDYNFGGDDPPTKEER
jgi:hypothetical protein